MAVVCDAKRRRTHRLLRGPWSECSLRLVPRTDSVSTALSDRIAVGVVWRWKGGTLQLCAFNSDLCFEHQPPPPPPPALTYFSIWPGSGGLGEGTFKSARKAAEALRRPVAGTIEPMQNRPLPCGARALAFDPIRVEGMEGGASCRPHW